MKRGSCTGTAKRMLGSYGSFLSPRRLPRRRWLHSAFFCVCRPRVPLLRPAHIRLSGRRGGRPLSRMSAGAHHRAPQLAQQRPGTVASQTQEALVASALAEEDWRGHPGHGSVKAHPQERVLEHRARLHPRGCRIARQHASRHRRLGSSPPSTVGDTQNPVASAAWLSIHEIRLLSGKTVRAQSGVRAVVLHSSPHGCPVEASRLSQVHTATKYCRCEHVNTRRPHYLDEYTFRLQSTARSRHRGKLGLPAWVQQDADSLRPAGGRQRLNLKPGDALLKLLQRAANGPARARIQDLWG